MSDRSAIEWTDASWNPVRARNRETGQVGWYCEHVSEGCRNCYAEGFNARLGTRLEYKPGNLEKLEIFLDEKTLLQPLRWKRPRKIFAGSMTDLFGAWVTDEMLDRMFAVMALCPQHTLQVLTKRPERMLAYLTSCCRDGINHSMNEIAPANWCARELEDYGDLPLKNIWLGVSCEDQPSANERIPQLLNTPAAARFISAEPLLGPIDLMGLINWPEASTITDALQGAVGHNIGPDEDGRVEWDGADPCGRLDWVICGGESGSSARPMHPDWARSLRDQCAAAGVPFFFKQWGEYCVLPPDRELGREHIFLTRDWDFVRVGKRAAGRLLDGVEHSAFPQVPR